MSFNEKALAFPFGNSVGHSAGRHGAWVGFTALPCVSPLVRSPRGAGRQTSGITNPGARPLSSKTLIL